jgi:hypothetical protein
MMSAVARARRRLSFSRDQGVARENVRAALHDELAEAQMKKDNTEALKAFERKFPMRQGTTTCSVIPMTDNNISIGTGALLISVSKAPPDPRSNQYE